MFTKLKIAAAVLFVGFIAYSFFGPSTPQTADLGAVLDRTQYAIEKYSEHLDSSEVTQASVEDIENFRGFLIQVLNSEPRFYDATQGLNIEKDAKFLAFEDNNGNGVKDSGEGGIYTVEIDEEKNRLIATDMTGNSTGLGFSGTGFLAGALLGSLISRQRAAGVSKSSFGNRNVSSRASYKAPRSSRSGGLRSGK